MKKLLLVLIVVLLPMHISGQQTIQKTPLPLAKYNDNVKLPLTSIERAQILEVYGDKADKYVFSNPHMLKSIKQILRNRVIVRPIANPNEKKPCPKLSEVSIFNGFVKSLERDKRFSPKTFNPLKYNFEFFSVGASMYQVDDTNYYIIIKSQYQ